PDLVVVHRSVDRVQLQLRVVEPVAQLGDLASIAIVQVLARAEDLDGRDACLHRLVQPSHRKTVIHAHVRGKNTIHVGQNPLAVPSVLGSAAPWSHLPSDRMAATAPCESAILTLWPRDLSSSIVSGEKPVSMQSSSGSH